MPTSSSSSLPTHGSCAPSSPRRRSPRRSKSGPAARFSRLPEQPPPGTARLGRPCRMETSATLPQYHPCRCTARDVAHLVITRVIFPAGSRSSRRRTRWPSSSGRWTSSARTLTSSCRHVLVSPLAGTLARRIPYYLQDQLVRRALRGLLLLFLLPVTSF